MALTKVQYTDNVTVIGAKNLNDIQDEIIANGNNINFLNSGKVDKVAGKGLSTLDFTVADRQAIDNAYVKPATGVPKTDLSQDVQTSLDKADNALQAALDATLGAILNGSNTTQVFRSWYAQAGAASPADNRYTLLCRFAAMLRNAWGDKVYTLKYVDPATSGAPAMTPVGDLAQLSAAQLCTDSTTPVADWTDEDPLGGWYIRANALSLADGAMNVLAIEGVDDAFDITGTMAPVYTFAPALWRRKI